jgi:3-oxoacyl-[acyl-carrier protein] reductase
VAVITGAGRGIGRCAALALAKEGCRLVAASRTESELKKLAKEAKEYGASVECLVFDAAEPEKAGRLVDTAVERFGQVDILINNAGINIHNQLIDASLEELELSMRVNLYTPFELCRRALIEMKKKKTGYIVNVSSRAIYKMNSNITTYCITKRALHALSQVMYEEALEYGVKVSTVIPGRTETAMTKAEYPDADTSTWLKAEEVAESIIYLLKQSNMMIVREIVVEPRFWEGGR